jgi:hypothetical protein
MKLFIHLHLVPRSGMLEDLLPYKNNVSLWQGVNPSRGKVVLFFVVSVPALDPIQPPHQLVRVVGVLSHGVRWPGLEANTSLSSSDVKNCGTILPHMSLRPCTEAFVKNSIL